MSEAFVVSTMKGVCYPRSGKIKVPPDMKEKRLVEYEMDIGDRKIKVFSDPCRRWGGTLGSCLWSAGVALARALGNIVPSVEGKRVLEIGAGLGIVGSAASLNGAKHVIVTDLLSMLPLLKKNVAWNLGSDNEDSKWSVCELNWGDTRNCKTVLSMTPQNRFDVVLAADVTYDTDMYFPLYRTICEVTDQDTDLFMALMVRFEFDDARERKEADYEPFFRLARKAFDIKLLAQIPKSKADTVNDIIIVHMKKRSKQPTPKFIRRKLKK